VRAVRSGEIPEAVVDRKVARILTLACRVGALEGFPAAEPAWAEDGIAFVRQAGIEGTVLLENRGELPWDPARLRSVTVIGDNAANARTQGGGSATVMPEYTVSPLDGLRAALPGPDITYARGAVVQEGVVELPLAQMTNPVTGELGLRVRFLGSGGTELFAEDRRSSALVWFGGDAPIGRSAMVELATRFTPAESGPVRVGFAAVGHGKVYLDGELIVDEIAVSEHTDLGAALMAPPTAAAEVNLTAGGRPSCASSTTWRAGPARWPNCCGCASAPSPRSWTPMLSSPPPRKQPRPLTWRWSSSAPTPRWSPRATTAPRSRCPAARMTWSAPSPLPTRGPSCW